MKHLFTLKSLLLTLVMLCGLNAWGETATLTFEKACGGSGTDNKGNTWTVTSDAAESTFDSTKGVHYGTGKKAVSYLQLTTTINGTITSIKVNASGASGTSAKLNVTVGGSAFGSESSITTTATDYTFTGNATGDIVVKLSQAKAKIALYVKSIVVTYEVVAAAVEKPVITASAANLNGNYFTTSTAKATIDCTTEGATIKYTITDGTAEPTNWINYTVGDEIKIISANPATKTLWAKADKDGKSAVASKEFTFIKEPVSLKYELVVDESQIVEGAKYIIADGKGAAVMGTTLDTKGYYNAIESGFNLSGNMLSIYETAGFASIEFQTVPESGDKTWFVKYNNGDDTYTYLKGKAKDLASSASAEDAASISIEADNTVKMIFASNTANYYLKYNESNKRFKAYSGTDNINFIKLYRVYEESEPTATDTGLDEVLVGDAGKKYKISCQLRVNYKDANYVYASTTKGGFTKTAPTEAQKKEWWSDTADDFNQNDWVAIEGLDVEVGTEIAGGSTVVLCKNAAFPVVKFVSEVTTATVGAIDANTYRVANFVDSNNELVKKLWLVDPQPAEHCFVKGYVASLNDVLEDETEGFGTATIKSGDKDVVTMTIYYNPTDFSITATGWYRFEGVVVSTASGLQLNAVKMNEGTATGVEGVETSSVKVYGAEGVINVESEEVAPIAVYSANGAIVSSVEASSASIAVAPGFYIVKAGNSVSKVTVK